MERYFCGVKKKVLMLLTNPFRPDPRVYKEARALLCDGYEVTILCWDRELSYVEYENMDEIRIIRVKCKSSYGKVKDFLKGIICYYKKSLKILRDEKFDIVHAHDLDTFILGLLISKTRKKKLILDLHDDYAAMVSRNLPVFLYKLLDLFQKIAVRFADGLIVANDELNKIVEMNGIVIRNVADIKKFEINSEDIRAAKKRLGIEDDAFIIVYIGILRDHIALLKIINVVKKIDGCYFVIGGDGPAKDKILNHIDNKKIIYLGWVNMKEIPLYTKMANCIVILLDPKNRCEKIGTPNKLFEAMAAGVPVIVSRGTLLEKIVKEENCGLTVDYCNENELYDAILLLYKNVEMRNTLGMNGYMAMKKKYSAASEMKKLLNMYRSILK